MYLFSEEPYCDKECIGCDERDNKITDVKYWLQYLLDQLYGNFEQLDVNELERSLEELCASVGMKIPFTKILLKNTQLSDANRQITNDLFDIDSWKSWNQNYLKNALTR